MSAPAAIRATFSQYAMVKTRGVLVLHMEVPLEAQAEVFAALGYPLPGNEVWCGIARLNPNTTAGSVAHAYVGSSDGADPPQGGRPGEEMPPAPSRPDFVASQRAKAAYAKAAPGEQAVTRAALLAADPRFWAWVSKPEQGSYGLSYDSEDQAAGFIRNRCCFGESRKLIAEDPECLSRFLAMEIDYKIFIGALPEPR